MYPLSNYAHAISVERGIWSFLQAQAILFYKQRSLWSLRPCHQHSFHIKALCFLLKSGILRLLMVQHSVSARWSPILTYCCRDTAAFTPSKASSYCYHLRMSVSSFLMWCLHLDLLRWRNDVIKEWSVTYSPIWGWKLGKYWHLNASPLNGWFVLHFPLWSELCLIFY